ncbi:MAG: tyrosine-type recombinase/integrase [Actinomycetota bacterium]|nr:tyrosine-type recombinase/integrase [Actinomycetota bacterium]
MTTETTPASVVGDLSTLIGDFERSLAAATRPPGQSASTVTRPVAARLPARPGHHRRPAVPVHAGHRLPAEGEVRGNPFQRMKPPAIPQSPVPVLSDDELRRLLASCKGPTFEHRCDAALVRLLIDCGVRCSELVNLTVDDRDRDAGTIAVIGKGRRPRLVPYGRKSAHALDRYPEMSRPSPASPCALTIHRRLAVVNYLASSVRLMESRRSPIF